MGMRAKMEDEMSEMEERIKEKVSAVIMELVQTVEEAVTERARARAVEAVSQSFSEVSGAKPARAVANGQGKRKSWFPPCVVGDCKQQGTPRHYGACVDHKDKPKAELLKLRKAASEEGGKNFGWKRGVGMPRGRKPSAKPEKAAKAA